MSEAYFPWDAAKYGLNVREMDDEHQVLISKMNALRSLHEQGENFFICNRALHDLIAYTKKHFADEEAYMERIGFPRLRIHKGIHKQLLDRLTELEQQFRSEKALSLEMFSFFKMWLTAHICGIDAQYAAHARSVPAASRG